MKNNLLKFIPLALVPALSGSMTAQNTSLRTITIVNGDTTITENSLPVQPGARERQVVREERRKDKEVEGRKEKEIHTYSYSYDFRDDKSADGAQKEMIIDHNPRNGSPKTPQIRKAGTISTSFSLQVKDETLNLDADTGSEPLTISVLDRNGKQILLESNQSGGKYHKEIRLEKGTYFLSLIHGNKSESETIEID